MQVWDPQSLGESLRSWRWALCSHHRQGWAADSGADSPVPSSGEERGVPGPVVGSRSPCPIRWEEECPPLHEDVHGANGVPRVVALTPGPIAAAFSGLSTGLHYQCLLHPVTASF